jgi:hypothetical protein
MDFTPIEQTQLRELAKRCTRWKFSSGLSYGPVRRGVVAVTRFARFLISVAVDDLTGVDRPVLERYLADLHAEYGGNNPHWQGSHIGLVNQFFHAIRQHRWELALPGAAMFFTEDVPKRTERLARGRLQTASYCVG